MIRSNYKVVEMKNICLLLCLLFVSCGKLSTDNDNTVIVGYDEKEVVSTTEDDSLLGCLHGESSSRKENFDSIKDVTYENVYKLYSLYDVTPMLDGEYYKIESKKIYTNAKYFTRLLRFKDGRQSSAITFYGYSLKQIISFDNKVLLALNSLPFQGFSFQCKTVLLDGKLSPIKGQMFKAHRGEFCSIDTMYVNGTGFSIRISDEVFDGGIINIQDVQIDKNNKITKIENLAIN